MYLLSGCLLEILALYKYHLLTYLLTYLLIVLCLVKRDNVIFAVTRHGGHLGYFEGGIVLPHPVSWLDRIILEFCTAMLHCTTGNPQQHPRQSYGPIRSWPERTPRF